VKKHQPGLIGPPPCWNASKNSGEPGLTTGAKKILSPGPFKPGKSRGKFRPFVNRFPCPPGNFFGPNSFWNACRLEWPRVQWQKHWFRVTKGPWKPAGTKLTNNVLVRRKGPSTKFDNPFGRPKSSDNRSHLNRYPTIYLLSSFYYLSTYFLLLTTNTRTDDDGRTAGRTTDGTDDSSVTTTNSLPYSLIHSLTHSQTLIPLYK